ncbi:hypothetical protein FLJC2902T_17200 [Flavobacterium limnosediminis JC2902]|uniref:Uncharacterized protein n=1 Tax=Flavobacterium limnosediminis JC2902 TaxID=1341181 RepID=V6SPJ9_9FLAO|nr:hypothetical protein [Flavobacterium limnosediminis]ESU28369.1 hypothetical protein FLJC2902T_17200 [Flavobacterium limnosediminis JC2902]
MKAETAYNVAMSLPPGELERLLTMLQKEAKPKEPKQTKRKQEEEVVWTYAECYEKVYKLLMDRKKRKTAPTPPFKANQ